MSVRLRLAGAALLCAFAGLAGAPRALAEPYSATYVGQCCYMTLESGEVAGGQFFEFRNTGTATWTDADFRLGTSIPLNRTSAFLDSSWLGNGRPAKITPQAVAPGQNGRFNFSVRAPSVAAQTTYREHFEPLRELVAWTGTVVFLDYTVLPSIPPTVGFTSVPAAATQGATLEVAVDATDNRSVQRVEFTVDAQTVTVTTPESNGRTFRAQIPTTNVPTGPQTVIARAVDRVGNFATSTATVTIAAAPPDRDGDGTLGTTDCNDTNPAVHPGAVEIAGNGLDDDCDGATTPGRVTSTVQNGWVASAKATRVTGLKVRGAPAGATIEVRCNGRGCPFKLKRAPVATAGDVDLRKRFLSKARLRVGAVLEIRVLANDSIAKVARFTMRKGKPPRSAYLCLSPGAPKPATC